MRLPKKRHVIWAAIVLAGLGAVWARRALPERFNAIPASGGEVFSMAPIPTPHYLQKDPRWENDTIGGTGERLARVGCTVCSLTMALDHYGVRTNPKELNEFFKRNEGYTFRGWLKWNTVEKFSQNAVAMDYIGRPDYARIDQTLKNGQPVLAKVLLSGIIPHWILIVGKERSDYLIRDPLDQRKSLKRASQLGSKIYAIRTLRRGTNPPN